MRDNVDSRPIYRVFVSSTAEDLKDHRKAVLEALERLDVVKLVNQESFGARSAASTVAECRRLVEISQVVVVVVAYRYGWVPTEDEGGDNENSITALEVAAAKSKPLVFLVDPTYGWRYSREQDDLANTPADPSEVKRRVRLLGEFRERLSAAPVDWFTTPNDLAAKVTTAVSNEIIRMVRETEMGIAGGATDHVVEQAEPRIPDSFRWQRYQKVQERPIAPLLVNGGTHLTRQKAKSVPISQFFQDWQAAANTTPFIAIVDFPLDIVDSIGRLTAGVEYGCFSAQLGELDRPFEEIHSQLNRFIADHDIRTLFVDFSSASLEDCTPSNRRTATYQRIRNFLDAILRASQRAGVRCAIFIPRFLVRRPYVSTLPETPFMCETAPMFDGNYAGRIQWLTKATKVRRFGTPLDRLLSVNSDSAVRLVADFLNTHAISGTLDTNRRNSPNLDILLRLADLLARSRFYEIAFRLERYCRTLQADRIELEISANIHSKNMRIGEPDVVGFLRNATTLPPTLDRAALLSPPGGGKTTLLEQIDLVATVPVPTDRSAPAVTFRIARSRYDEASVVELLIDKLRYEARDGGRALRVHQTLAEVLPAVRLGDIFSSRVLLLLDTDGVLRVSDLETLEDQLVGGLGPPETTGFLIAVTNETPPAQRPIPCIELRRLTTAQIERAFGRDTQRFLEFLDLERFATEFSDLLRSPFVLNALIQQPTGERLAIGRALRQVVEARLNGLPLKDEIRDNLTRIAHATSLEQLRGLDADPDWLTEATESKLVARAKGTMFVRFENTLIREFFLARNVAHAAGESSPTTPASRLFELDLNARSRSRVSVLCIDLLERSDIAPFVRELADKDALLAHTAALYSSWRAGALIPEARTTAEAVLLIASSKPSPAKLLTALGPADPRLVPSRVGVPRVSTSGDNPLDLEIALYPTTNWEFLDFVKDGGYARSEFWSSEGQRWHTKAGRPRQPQNWIHPERSAPNFPVRGVSFFEAEAYCRWLSSQYDDSQFWLPSAGVWDLVAHGEQQHLWAAIVDGWQQAATILSKLPGVGGDLSTEEIELLMRLSQSSAGLGDEAMQQYSNVAPQNSISPIGVGSPNTLGVYDMYGLCWQWCATSVDGSDIEPFWGSKRQRTLTLPLLVKGGAAGEHDLPAVWSFIGSWFMPDMQYDGIGFRTVCLRASSKPI